MAAFSYDSMVFLPNMSPINDNNFSQFYDDPSATEKQSTDNDSTVVDKLENGDDEQVTQNVTTPSTTDKKRKTMNGKSLDSMDHQGGKRRKQQKKKDEKTQEGEPPKGYIHVRARRGQATDSHSLAERVRREKISERMKILQCLVPGCDKVTGKAHMLDEIINYVQSLQNQVELSSINPTFYDFGVDLEALMVKPESLMNSFASPPPPPQPHLPPLQQCNPTQPTTTTTASTGATFAPPHDYPLLDASASVFLHQGGRRPNVLLSSHPQDNASLLWELGCFH